MQENEREATGFTKPSIVNFQVKVELEVTVGKACCTAPGPGIRLSNCVLALLLSFSPDSPDSATVL